MLQPPAGMSGEPTERKLTDAELETLEHVVLGLCAEHPVEFAKQNDFLGACPLHVLLLANTDQSIELAMRLICNHPTLLLERYDPTSKVLAECEPKVLFTDIPMMWFQPMEIEKIPQVQHYNCPLYKESARRGVLATTGHSSNFVMFLKLPSDRPAAHWIRRGLAALCQLDD